MRDNGFDVSHLFHDDRCPNCREHIVARLKGKDGRSGMYVECPLCHHKTAKWFTEAMALRDWARQQERIEK